MDFPGRVIKIGETDAAIVKAVAQRLRDLGYQPSSPDGQYDSAFKSMVSLFQSQHVDALERPLKVDGEIGPLTWGSLFGAEEAPSTSGTLREAALAEAKTQNGVREIPLGSNRGPDVERYLASVGLGGGFFWCMAFVHFCFREAAQNMGAPNPFPRTAGVLDAWNKAKKFRITKNQAIADPSLVIPGSVFILDFGSGHGHTGFVEKSVGGALKTVEGNTNTDGSSNGIGVFELNRRNIMDRSLRGFIIIP